MDQIVPETQSFRFVHVLREVRCLLLPLCFIPAVLKPDLHLGFRQSQSAGQVSPLWGWQVFLKVKLLLQFKHLDVGKRRSGAFLLPCGHWSAGTRSIRELCEWDDEIRSLCVMQDFCTCWLVKRAAAVSNWPCVHFRRSPVCSVNDSDSVSFSGSSSHWEHRSSSCERYFPSRLLLPFMDRMSSMRKEVRGLAPSDISIR